MDNNQFDFQVLSNRTKLVSNAVHKALGKSMDIVLDDVVRASSNATPFEYGTLSQSWAKGKSTGLRGGISGTVAYNVTEKGSGGRYNYAIRMHEDTSYSLGEASRARGGGTGMSGRTYEVGPKFLTRVLDGESQTYRNRFERDIFGSIRSSL
ncbi:hypothetical protein [Geomicrobium sp. JCM 19055]|uniref:hypothetical protein n=1 Tax=Geomicrobium sp. JCM 19055 TaxID=1460649 RepID=UPI0005A61CE7|nr:hypothetical protein [Geomicrobium sp. JCM 19055]